MQPWFEIPWMRYDRHAWIKAFGDQHVSDKISWDASIDDNGTAVYMHHDDGISGGIVELKFNLLPPEHWLITSPMAMNIIAQLPTALCANALGFGVTRYEPHTFFPMHTDPKRQAVIMFPLEPRDPAPITFHDKDGTVINKTYEHATVINSKHPHSMRNDHRARMVLQLSLQIPFKDAVEELAKHNA